MPKKERLLTTAEAAEVMKTSLRRVQQLILTGRLPAEKFGRDWMVKESNAKKPPPLPIGRPRKEEP